MYSKFIPEHFTDNFDYISKNNYIRTEGYVMFADLSGFTAMSEKLSTKGNEGSEEISRILNMIFEDLIGIIQKRGGSIYKFGGDALTVFFPERVFAVSVNNCGLELVKAMKKYASIPSISGYIRIEIKIGTAYGSVLIGQLGRDEKDYFLAGSTLDRACECEHNATKGESLIDNSFKNKLVISTFKEKTEGIFIAEELKETAVIKIKPKAYQKNNDFGSFTRKILMDKEKEGDFGQGELRNCAVLFMSFEGIDYNKNFNYTELNDLVSSVFEIAGRYSGFVNKVDMGDKGNKIIILFGAPAATENYEELAGRCAVEIIKSLKGSISARIGINSGNIYFGVIGSKNRLEFTVIGSTVNLSARLMTSCGDNEIIISERTLSKISSAIANNQRGLTLKGIKEKFYVSTLTGFEEKRSAHKIAAIGRDKEIREYKNILKNGQIKKIFISAEAGTGKSVLAQEFKDAAVFEGKVFWTECLSYASETPYFIIRELISSFLEDINSDKLSALKKLFAGMKEESNFDLYADFMGLTHLKVKTDDSMKNLIEDLTISIFLNLLEKPKAFIFIDDAHWIDDQSLKILKRLLDITDEMNCIFHLIFRPDQKLTDLFGGKNGYLFQLDSFGKEEGKLYIEKKFRIKKVPAGIYELVYSKSKGNPFYMDEIILSIKSKGGLKERTDGFFGIDQKLKEIIIPDNINDIILSRIDKLDNNSKRILKIASVIGRVFQINVLNQLKELQEKISDLNLRSRLFDLTEMNFTVFELNKNDEYLFKHAITRDAVYETLLFSIRRKYHEEIARIYEENSQERLENFYELLAFHYRYSGNISKAKQYTMLSAEKSSGNFSYESAINYIELYKKFKLSKEEKIRCYLFEAEILRIIEKRDKAIQLCERVKKIAVKGDYFFDKAVSQNTFLYFKSSRYDKVFEESALLSKKSDINMYVKTQSLKGFAQLFSGQTSESEKTASRVYSLRAKLTDFKVETLVLNLSGTLNLHKRKISDAKVFFKEMYKIAEENQLTDEKLKAIQNISVCYANSGEYKNAKEYLEKLYDEAVKIHNYDLIIGSINNLAAISYVTGDYKGAEKTAEKGLKIARKFKKHTLVDDILGSLSNIKLEQGKYKEVLKICSERLNLAEEHNNLKKIPAIKDIMGDAYYKSGDLDTALKIYIENLENAVRISDTERIGHSYGNIANCYSDTGKYDKALEYYDMQLKYAVRHEDKQSEGKALHNLADTYFRGIKDLKSAIKYCRKANKIFADIGYEFGLKMSEELLQEIRENKC